MSNPIRFAVLTISDRSSRGERPDASGPALVELIQSNGWNVILTGVIADDQDSIRATLIQWCQPKTVDVILTTGGTGFAPRDITPEATLQVIERQTMGLVEAMRAESLKKTPHAMLSRAVAGIRGSTLIINLPGSPKAAVENLTTILSVLPHAVELIQDSPASETGHQTHIPGA